MKDEIEGNFIPVKLYELVLPPGYTPEQSQQFATTLPMKKNEKIKDTPKIQTTVRKIDKDLNFKDQNDPEEDVLDGLFDKPVIEKGTQSIPKTVSGNVKKNIEDSKKNNKRVIARPYSAVLNKVPSYLNTNQGKTLKETNLEQSTKVQAKEFVEKWVQQADEKRKNSLKLLETKEKPFKKSDNKLSDEITELMKKLAATRKNTFKSIKSMKKTLKTTEEISQEKPELLNNPFRTSIVFKNSPNPNKKLIKPGLDLHELYGSTKSPVNWIPNNLATVQSEAILISDDESFIKDIELDDN
jgi:hypothetical protein